MRFGGPYAQTDLASVYGTCDFTWAIDYSQRGQNSDWLLPNRRYEGTYYNSPAIAVAGTETASWLKSRKAGILLGDPKAELDFVALIVSLQLTTTFYNVHLQMSLHVILRGQSRIAASLRLGWQVDEIP